MILSIYKLFLILSLLLPISLQAIEKGTPVRIMPLGDSITYDQLEFEYENQNPRPIGERTSYRSHLWYRLQDGGYLPDFVGSQKAGYDILPPFDPDNEGHPGATSFNIAESLYGYLANAQPDIILLHIGTNDYTTSAEGIEMILNQIAIYESNSGKSIHLYIAQIIDRKNHDPIIAAFNQDLTKRIQEQIKLGKRITLVDMYHRAGLTPDDYADNTHPNSNGYAKMANVWFNALIAPYTYALYQFASHLLPADFIESITVDEADKTVTIIAEIPDEGIGF